MNAPYFAENDKKCHTDFALNYVKYSIHMYEWCVVVWRYKMLYFGRLLYDMTENISKVQIFTSTNST